MIGKVSEINGYPHLKRRFLFWIQDEKKEKKKEILDKIWWRNFHGKLIKKKLNKEEKCEP